MAGWLVGWLAGDGDWGVGWLAGCAFLCQWRSVSPYSAHASALRRRMSITCANVRVPRETTNTGIACAGLEYPWCRRELPAGQCLALLALTVATCTPSPHCTHDAWSFLPANAWLSWLSTLSTPSPHCGNMHAGPVGPIRGKAIHAGPVGLNKFKKLYMRGRWARFGVVDSDE